jgi:hypothetical protein
LPVNGKATTNHIPGEDGLPFFGKTFEQLKDPLAFQRNPIPRSASSSPFQIVSDVTNFTPCD